MKITNHHELRKRKSLDLSHPKITDQSSKKMCDINCIIASYQKTGMLPHFKEKHPQFLDETKFPTFMEAHDTVQQASDLFNQLPSIVRKAMNNNPANLEEFINDPKNHSFLSDHGIIEKQEKSLKNDSDPSRNATTKSVKDEVKKKGERAE